MLKLFIFFGIFMSFLSLNGEETSNSRNNPEYLYKILSIPLWEASQNNTFLTLPAEDTPFIHLAKEDQLEKIINKYWASAHDFVILKIQTDALTGQLVYETNPGGTTKYYHLYEGKIPLSSIAQAKIVHR